jgi:hypothetical protein
MPAHLPSGFKPAVENLFHTFQLTFTFLRGDGDMIDLFSVDIGDPCNSRQTFQLCDRANTDDLKK